MVGPLALALLAGAGMAPSARAPAQAASPVNNWAEFRAALTACWSVPPETGGSLIAFRFGLDKTGALRGPPLVTARRLNGDRDARKRYEDAANDALSRCFPISVTPAFGAILGESPIRLRFVNTPPVAAYQLNSNITVFAPP
ncbi:hypothetical protein [Methylobacterium sp. J-090]|uniref:hypothetical protein n=1 Tax=Methylobacterium sp. J-090 TaxID=2836666 RepID=UPI001FB95A35|nr:hypothetical protein [Methylobacterium sp. J-090]MCJ2080515.1 hypothetical protein [Methylobacterium sp. J-090]